MIDQYATTGAGPYWDGDIPAGDIVIELDEAIGDYTQVAPSFDGTEWPTVAVDPDDMTITVPWPAATTLAGGKHKLTLRPEREVEGIVLARTTLGSIPVFVQDDDGWHTLSSARVQWVDAPRDPTLWELLSISRDRVLTEGPALADDAAIPDRYRLAQLMDAKALWQKNQSTSDDDLNSGSFSVSIYPMDKTIRSVIRPASGFPRSLIATTR